MSAWETGYLIPRDQKKPLWEGGVWNREIHNWGGLSGGNKPGVKQVEPRRTVERDRQRSEDCGTELQSSIIIT